MQPTASIIVPNFRHAAFLDTRINSVLEQTYQDFEVIILDDCSPDNSRDIIDRYRNHPKVSHVVYNSNNSGNTFKQWNKGVGLAKGKYVWIAESDDYAEPDLLSSLIEGLEKDERVGLAMCASYLVDEFGSYLARWEEWSSLAKSDLFNREGTIPGRRVNELQLSLGNVVPNASAVVIRKSAYESIGLAAEDLRVCGDWLTWSRILNGWDFYFTPRPMNYFRKHSSTVRSNNEKNGVRVNEYYLVLNEIAKSLEENKKPSSAMLNLLSERLARHTIQSAKSAQSRKTLSQIYKNGRNCDKALPVRAGYQLCKSFGRKAKNYIGRRVPSTRRNAPIEQVTKGPKYHWFGYYDKFQTDPKDELLLTMASDFENRTPTKDDSIEIAVVDLSQNNKKRTIASTKAWCWQQGCMLQWIPSTTAKIIWNDRREDRFISVIFDYETEEKQELPEPIYCISPNGERALTLDFERINDVRPGYGYAGVEDRYSQFSMPEKSGIYDLDIHTGEKNLLLSIRTITECGDLPRFADNAKHYVNHLLYNPAGDRFVFLHRWRYTNSTKFGTRLMAANSDGSNLKVIDDFGHASHFNWKSESELLIWTFRPKTGYAFHIYNIESGSAQPIGEATMTRNGHCSYLPNSPEFIVNDTYPNDLRKQELYLFNELAGNKSLLGTFHSPLKYQGEFRCDLHPRVFRNGKGLIIDSAHKQGRQQHVVRLEDFH